MPGFVFTPEVQAEQYADAICTERSHAIRSEGGGHSFFWQRAYEDFLAGAKAMEAARQPKLLILGPEPKVLGITMDPPATTLSEEPTKPEPPTFSHRAPFAEAVVRWLRAKEEQEGLGESWKRALQHFEYTIKYSDYDAAFLNTLAKEQPSAIAEIYALVEPPNAPLGALTFLPPLPKLPPLPALAEYALRAEQRHIDAIAYALEAAGWGASCQTLLRDEGLRWQATAYDPADGDAQRDEESDEHTTQFAAWLDAGARTLARIEPGPDAEVLRQALRGVTVEQLAAEAREVVATVEQVTAKSTDAPAPSEPAEESRCDRPVYHLTADAKVVNRELAIALGETEGPAPSFGALLEQVRQLAQREPTRDEMLAVLGDKDEAFLRGTVRRCEECRRPVFGGPTRCEHCVGRGRGATATELRCVTELARALGVITVEATEERPAFVGLLARVRPPLPEGAIVLTPEPHGGELNWRGERGGNTIFSGDPFATLDALLGPESRGGWVGKVDQARAEGREQGHARSFEEGHAAGFDRGLKAGLERGLFVLQQAEGDASNQIREIAQKLRETEVHERTLHQGAVLLQGEIAAVERAKKELG